MSLSHTNQLDFVVGELVLLDGRRQSEAVHMAVLMPPRRAARDRRHETMFVFLDLGGGGASGLARAMIECLGRTYWRNSGTVTTALRQAFRAVNSHLQEENRLLAIGQRRQGGLVCAVLRDEYLYLARVGPVKALLFHGDELVEFPADSPEKKRLGSTIDANALGRSPERLPLGVSSALDVQFYHRFLYPGDRLLLTGASWSGELPAGALADALARDTVEDVMLALEQQARQGAFSALVLGCVPRVPWTDQSEAAHQAKPPTPQPPARPGPAKEGDGGGTTSRRWPVSNPLSRVPSQRERLEQAREGLRRTRQALGDGTHALLTRVLPDPELTPAQRSRRARIDSSDNVPVMAGIAVAIPLLVAFVVVTFYLQRSASARRDALVNRALEAAQAAREVQGGSSRDQWNEALQAAQDALLVAPRDREVLTIRDQARATLDVLNGVRRPEFLLLWDYGAGAQRRLAASRMQVYVLDPAQNQVTQHTLDPARQNVADDQLALVAYRGEIVGEGEIGPLRDVTWLKSGGEWVGDALLILTQESQLLQYSLSWGLSWVPFDTGLAHVSPSIIRPYGGKLYVLDRQENQVWRFAPSVDGFGPPNGYFAAAAPDLNRAVDMTIDGAVFLLMDDGNIRKFFAGEEQPFQISGMPQSLERPVALVHEGDVGAGALYVADADANAIIALSKDGQFLFQIQAPFVSSESTNSVVLAGMEALAVEEEGRTLYVLAQGRLYALGLPPLP